MDWGRYDFVDLGCSSGGSIRHCLRRFGVASGIGVDLNPAKVARTREAGFDAFEADASTLDLDRQVSFVSMMNFLEHLPDLDVVERIVAAAARSARDFLYIRHPSFEGEEMADAMGVRQYWWDWRHHTAHVHVADYCAMFERLGLPFYKVRYVGRITDTTDPSIIPTSSPRNTSGRQAAEIETPYAELPLTLWRRQDIFVALRPFEPGEWQRLTRPTASDLRMMRATGQLAEERELVAA